MRNYQIFVTVVSCCHRCADGIHKAEECEWGSWLLVNYDTYDARGPSGRGGACGGSFASREVALEGVEEGIPGSPMRKRR